MLSALLAFSSIASANTPPYLTEKEYEEQKNNRVFEDNGIVVSNNPALGYLVYRNSYGEECTANYYSNEIVVEKQPYYESEDRIGYLDELFPHFNFDPRDTTVAQLMPGDNIYIQMDTESNIKYISAYNEYIMRYGKVKTWRFGSGDGNLVIEDETGRVYAYTIPYNTPITKGANSYALSSLKEGEWVKLLVSQKILGEGILEEAVLEIATDPDTRIISNIYRGQVASVDNYKQAFNLKSAQTLQKTGWGPYTNLMVMKVDPKIIQSYYGGNPVSWDYVARNLRNTNGYVYVAAEQFMGKESAVKLNFQSKMQRTLPPTTVTYTAPGVIKLLSGETLHMAKDAIVVRGKRLVEPYSIMIGDRVQAVVTDNLKLAVANVLENPVASGLQIFRARIKNIEERENFEVETFSLLDNNTWYFHPAPRTFALGPTTKFYTEAGAVINGIESFLAYGEKSKVKEVYTVVALGDEAKMVVDMPYVKESAKGEIYQAEDGSIKLKDVYYYHTGQQKWMLHSNKNTGVTIEIPSQCVIVKNGQVVSTKALEKGDKVKVMLEKSLKGQTGATGYIIVVEN